MKRIAIANWKMNPDSFAKAKKLFLGIKKIARTKANTTVVVAPPVVFLPALCALYRGTTLSFAAQDVSFEKHGAHTGEISAAMLRDAGASFVIVGHSERRRAGETDEAVNKKVHAALDAKLKVVLCIGERERHERDGSYLEFLTRQIETGLAGISSRQLARLMIAYEPIWAIGKHAEDAMKPHDLHETVLFIKKILTRTYGKAAAFKIPILYGGSVEIDNTALLLDRGAVNGFLVGHASLSPEAFSQILKTVRS